MRLHKGIFLSLILMMLFAGFISAQDSRLLVVVPKVIDPGTAGNLAFFEQLTEDSAYVYSQRYGDSVVIRYNQGKADYTAEIIASDQTGSQSMVLSLKRNSDGKAADPFTLLGDWHSLSPDYFAKLLYYLIASLDDFKAPEDSTPPLLLEKFTLEYMKFRDIQAQVYLNTYSSVFRPDGNLLIGAGSLALEFDENYHLVDIMGRDQLAAGKYTEFYDLAVNPSNVVYSRPAQGAYINRYVPGSRNPERIVTPFQYPRSFIVLTDGSIIMGDMTQPQIYRVESRRQTRLDITQGMYMSPQALAAGPSGEFWLFNSANGTVEIYTANGELIDRIMPFLPMAERYGISRILPAPDGSFLLMSTNSLFRFTRSGELIWKLDGVPGEASGSYAYASGMAFNENTGEIVVPFLSYGYILRLLDDDYLKRNNLPENPDRPLAALSRAAADDPYDADALAAIAMYHDNKGALELSEYFWNRVLQLEPDNAVANERLRTIDLALLRSQVEILRRKVIDTIEGYGPETARAEYQKAMGIYEEILHTDPDDRNSRLDRDSLELRFQQALARPGGNPNPLEIKNANLPDIFPSLVQYYSHSGWGGLNIGNPLSENAKLISIEFFIPGFMDLPMSLDIDRTLAPGENFDAVLKPVFGERILDLEEDISGQTRVTLKYQYNNEVFQQSANYATLIHRKTALSWDDSRKLAAFIVPNESTVRNFALVVSGGSGYRNLTPSQFNFPARFFRAMRIVDALGSYGIEYIEDPASPITQILGKENAVDTVRFPRATLYFQSGDCDDSTALLDSLFEAAGIRSAILTSPGHVFSAFDSGIPEENRWIFESPGTTVIPYDGTLWIPIETTALSKGFFQAWIDASRLVNRYRDGDFEFLPVFEARELYPPMSMIPSDYEIVQPSAERVKGYIDESVRQFTNVIYRGQADNLKNEIAGLSGRRKVRSMNRLGALQATFADTASAEITLRQAISLDSANILGYIYLTNLLMENGRYEEAIRIADEGLQKKPDSDYLLLSQAMASYRNNRVDLVRQNLSRLQTLNPDLAERYAYLDRSGPAADSSGSRAGIETPQPIWPGEDDGGR